MNEIKVNSSVASFHSYHYFVRTRKAFINQWRIQDSPYVGCQRTRWVQNFPKNCMKSRKIWAVGWFRWRTHEIRQC